MFEQIREQVVALVRDEEGASMVEYVLLVALIAVVAYVGFKALGGAVQDKANDATEKTIHATDPVTPKPAGG